MRRKKYGNDSLQGTELDLKVGTRTHTGTPPTIVDINIPEGAGLANSSTSRLPSVAVNEQATRKTTVASTTARCCML